MKFSSDIDIDFGDRDKILSIIEHIPAAMRKINPVRKHATGIYVTNVPYDPINNIAALDYNDAEERKYLKLDFLNVHVYSNVRDENHLLELMHDPNWDLLRNREFVEKLIHLNNQFDTLCSMPEPVNSITRLAMFLAIIRPGKKHLIGKQWKEIAQTVWDKGSDGYTFKKSHSLSYAWLVAVHMNILEEQSKTSSSQE